ncbi:MAG: hypothetical protein ACE366_26155 [Bradymonadia bacterium]
MLLRNVLIACALPLAVNGCTGDEKKKAEAPKSVESSKTPAPVKASKPTSPSKPVKAAKSVRRTLETWSPLSESIWRAAVYPAGLSIDLGTPDQFKYIRGDWGGLWGGLNADEQGVTYASILDPATLHLGPLKRPVVQTQIRARAPHGGEVVVKSGDTVLINGPLKPEWQAFSGSIAEGTFTVGQPVSLTVSGPKGLEIDWVWLGEQKGAAPPLPPRLMPLRLGNRTRRALPTPTPRSYVFHTMVPEKGQLVVDYGARQAAEFTISITDGGRVATQKRKADDGQWHEWALPLDSFTGDAVEITLSRISGDGVAGFGEPEIMVPPGPDGMLLATPATHGVVLVADGSVDAPKPHREAGAVRFPAAGGTPGAKHALWQALYGYYGPGWSGEGDGALGEQTPLETALQASKVVTQRFEGPQGAQAAAAWLTAQGKTRSVAVITTAPSSKPLDTLVEGLGPLARKTALIVVSSALTPPGPVGEVSIYYPNGGLPKDAARAELVELIDVPPTLLELMGLPPMKNAQGQSLLSWLDDRPVSRPSYAVAAQKAGRGVTVGPWHCFAEGPDAPMQVTGWDDPAEGKRSTVPRALCEVLLGEALARPAKSSRQGLEGGGASAGGGGEMDPELKKQLEALGYFGDD